MFLSKPFKTLAFFSLISMLFGAPARAVLLDSQKAPSPHSFTINTEMELQKRIDFSEPKSYEDIGQLFQDSPEYHVRCVREEDRSSKPAPEAKALFEKLALKNPTFVLNFEFKQQDLGFDVGLREELQNEDQNNPNQQHFTDTSSKDSLLGCDPAPPKEGEKEKTHACTSLSLTRSKNLSLQSEDYAPEASLEESWTIFPAAANEMYARLMLEYTATELDWMGRKAGRAVMSQHWICLLKPQDSN